MTQPTEYKPLFHIYGIYDKNHDKTVYIGKTNSMDHRIRTHKEDCRRKNKNNYNLPIYQYIRREGGWDNFYFCIFESFEEITQKELLKKEREYIKQHQNCLNVYKGKTEDPNYEKKYREGKKILCEACKCRVNRYAKARHDESKKHQKAITIINNNCNVTINNN